jgi:hypothetical protein
MKMNLLRWNNAQGPQGKSVEPSASHSGQGLGVKERFSTSGRGRSFFLTSPFYRSGVYTNYGIVNEVAMFDNYAVTPLAKVPSTNCSSAVTSASYLIDPI